MSFILDKPRFLSHKLIKLNQQIKSNTHTHVRVYNIYIYAQFLHSYKTQVVMFIYYSRIAHPLQQYLFIFIHIYIWIEYIYIYKYMIYVYIIYIIINYICVASGVFPAHFYRSSTGHSRSRNVAPCLVAALPRGARPAPSARGASAGAGPGCRPWAAGRPKRLLSLQRNTFEDMLEVHHQDP